MLCRFLQEQRCKSGLVKVMVCGQSLGYAALAHQLKASAVTQAPVFVLVLDEKCHGFVTQHRCDGHCVDRAMVH